MNMRKAVATIAWVALLACSALGQEPGIEADEDLSFDSPQQRGGRGGPGGGLVFKDRIAPHWFADNTRFWYRNDLANRGKEFILVDAEKGTREPAFDHAKLAASLSKATGSEVKADRLPFDEIAYIDDARAIKFKVGDSTWKCVLASYECSKTDEAPPEAPRRRRTRRSPAPEDVAKAAKVPAATGSSRPMASGPRSSRTTTSTSAPSPTARRARLSDDGKEGLAYGRLSWSPDSKTLVAFRIEPGDDKEVYLDPVVAARRRPGQAADAPLPAARRQVRRL